MQVKEIEGSKGYYVTDIGTVYRVLKNGEHKQVGSQDQRGYISCSITYRDGTSSSKLVHRLVAEAFIPNPDNLPMVDHRDEDKTNNTEANLRWCTSQQNVKFYNTMAGRDHHLQLNRNHKQAIKKLLAEVSTEKREVLRLTKELDKANARLVYEKERFEAQRLVEAKKINVMQSTYGGYSDTTGVKFGDVKTMVEATGKQITINGQLFQSCGAAAKWIVDKETEVGNIRVRDTISKELRRYLQGRRKAWSMYGVYTIGY